MKQDWKYVVQSFIPPQIIVQVKKLLQDTLRLIGTDAKAPKDRLAGSPKLISQSEPKTKQKLWGTNSKCWNIHSSHDVVNKIEAEKSDKCWKRL